MQSCLQKWLRNKSAAAQARLFEQDRRQHSCCTKMTDENAEIDLQSKM